MVILGLCILLIGALSITLPFFQVSKPLNFSVEVPKSQILLVETFTVPPSNVTHQTYLVSGQNISMLLSVKSAVSYSDEVLDFSVADGTHTYLSFSKISNLPYDFVWTVPKSANYSFVYGNSFSAISKNVTVQLTAESTQVENHSLLQKGPIVPFGFVYAGVVEVAVGVGLTVFGVARKENRSASPLFT
jgi:hypothetical protein